MATMGKRITRRKALATPADKGSVSLGSIVIDFVVSPIQIESIASRAFEPPVFGVPIMREGFVTETGPLISSAEMHTSINCLKSVI